MAAVVSAQSIPDSGLTFELVEVATVPDSASGNSAPPRISVVTQDPMGELFANDQRGPLYHIDESSGVVTEFLDLRDYPTIPVTSTFEAGFQAFAFHPDFYESEADGYGCFYTIHSCSNTTPTPDFDTSGSAGFHTLLLEWKAAGPGATTFTPANPSTPFREVMRLDQPYGNHNAGLIAFNPTVTPGDSDYGMLRISIGDGGSGNDPQNNGQTLSNPFGAILRIDPLGNDSANGAYGIPANAFATDMSAGTLAENYCVGLRNPQRFGWDLVTGEAFIADIGQNLFEEINQMADGSNFGWKGWNPGDGDSGNVAFVDPVAGYFHGTGFASPAITTGSKAVTCGEVSRGACITGLEGVLMVADFPNGRVFRLNVDTDPLDGGIDGLDEIRFKDGPSGSRSTFLDLINSVRDSRGLSDASRTDIRFSVNTPGRIFLSNKQDGVIRRMVPNEEPAIDLAADGTLEFNGILQVSDDLLDWQDVIPQPEQGEAADVSAPRRFYRSVRR
ncbi:hypothetical protein HAHE_29210 [Haloferula helveola]|uniref:Glucose/Sorbosone dehydrogenase domain-containing protein n=1 Tax=Haloferula helveola TaxID=490095 RepID=A0ABM7RMD1_9BACT|nr:hypothetical protein HAHE_29210 [Haloferula helveola]